MAVGTYYKVLNPGGQAIYGVGSWPLPTASRAGDWLEAEGELKPCSNGLHLCRRDDLVYWLGPEIYEAEIGGAEIVESHDKIVVRRARLTRQIETWNDRNARLFAADCAERVLPIFESRVKDDDRPRVAIEIARQFAMGTATCEEMDAARAAARDAARDAAWAAARNTQFVRLEAYLYDRPIPPVEALYGTAR